MKPSRRKPVFQETPDLKKARTLFVRQEYQKSLKLFEKVVRKQPHNILALTDAARAHGQRYELETALRFIRQILKITGGNARGLLLAGQSLRMCHRQEEALHTLEKAQAADPSSYDVHLELAVLYERRHQLELALESINQFLAIVPDQSEGMLLKARTLRRMGETEEAKRIYEDLTTGSSSPLQTKAQAANEWAHLLDSQGSYDEAFDKLLESKRIMTRVTEFSQAVERSKLEQSWASHFNASLTQSHLEDWTARRSGAGEKSILLTGCPRSGTTLIEKILDAHPEIVSADELGAFTDYIFPALIKGHRDEKGFFDAATLEGIPLPRLVVQEKRYRKYLEAAIDQKVGDRYLVDKNPSVTQYIAANLRLRPQNRILYALRDPRDIAVSCFFRWLPINSVSVRFTSFEETCRRTEEELSCWGSLRDIIPQERWMETRYEDTVADYEGEARRLLSWMDLEWDGSIVGYRDHLRERGVNSPTYEAVNQPIYTRALARWENYRSQIEKHFSILEPAMDKFGYSEK